MMSMTRRSAPRMRPAVDVGPRIDAVQSDTPAGTLGGFTALLESATQQILAVTYWFDPAPHPGPYPVTVRFTGRRIGVKGRVQAGDRFVPGEEEEEAVPRRGPSPPNGAGGGRTPGLRGGTKHGVGAAT